MTHRKILTGGVGIQKAIIFIGVFLLALIAFTVVAKLFIPSLETSEKADALYVAHTLATSLSALSDVEKGSITRDLNGTFDIEIGKYTWIGTITHLRRRPSRYWIKVTAYGKDGKKEKSGAVPFVSDLDFDEKKLENMTILRMEKDSGGKIRIMDGSSYVEASMKIMEKYRVYISNAVNKHGLAKYMKNPANFIAAIIKQESFWDEKAYRYEPNYDYKYIQEAGKLNNYPVEYIMTKDNGGMTIEEWFEEKPERKKYMEKGRDYSKYIAQTRIAASYGLMQILYTTAHEQGFRGKPEELYDPETNIDYGVKYLAHLAEIVKQRKYGTEENFMKLVDAAYNGGKRLIIDNCRTGSYCDWEIHVRDDARDITKNHVDNVMSYYYEYMLG